MLRTLAMEILDEIDRQGVEYGDVRVENSRQENITITGPHPEVIRQQENTGYGVRVLVNGAWGFAASDDLTVKGAVKTAKKALAVARASKRCQTGKRPFLPAPKIEDRYVTPHERHPFSVPLEEKIDLLEQAATIMLKNRGIRLARAFFDASSTDKFFASTKGSSIYQEIITCGAGILAYAIKNGEMQIRSFPNSFRGNFATAGWEFVKELDLVGNAPWVADEAAALLKAKPCPAMDDATVIIAPDQLALQIHESIGHPIELDRVFGEEASFAGTSFLSPDMIGSFQYASPKVTVVADATAPRGLGTFGYDDEGTPAGRVPIIEKGILKGFLSSCGTAPLLEPGSPSNGTCRAEGWRNIPLIRMTNINLEPGTWDFDDLVSDTANGILLETNTSWSIDDKRINFQFGTELAREIRNGKPGRIFKNPVYTGVTPVFWNSCDAVCNANYWQFYGTPNCGKGEPMQIMHVGHGTPPARFRNVKIGSSRK